MERMRKSTVFISLLVLALFGCQPKPEQPDQSEKLIADMAVIMADMKVYMLQVYDMPADSMMQFRPTDDVMSFEEHTAHVVANLYVHFNCFVKTDTVTNLDPAIEQSAKIMAITDRAALRLTLIEQFDEVSEFLKTMKTEGDWNKTRVLPQFEGKPEKDLVTILMMMRDHITHHRAQMIVYLRLMGYEPPAYEPF